MTATEPLNFNRRWDIPWLVVRGGSFSAWLLPLGIVPYELQRFDKSVQHPTDAVNTLL